MTNTTTTSTSQGVSPHAARNTIARSVPADAQHTQIARSVPACRSQYNRDNSCNQIDPAHHHHHPVQLCLKGTLRA
eukprot:2940984-Lingulodinium_polyedra.AAC.1